jgi:rhodanese-related sulfurtransferase
MAAGLAAKAGYKNVRLYAEGIPGWAKAGYPLNRDKAIPQVPIPALTPVELKARLNESYVLDIRLEQVFKQGHIKGSRNIPIHMVSRRYQEIPRDKTIIVIDILGNPDWAPIGWFLKDKGYPDVLMLRGGIGAWQKEGLPMEKAAD